MTLRRSGFVWGRTIRRARARTVYAAHSPGEPTCTDPDQLRNSVPERHSRSGLLRTERPLLAVRDGLDKIRTGCRGLDGFRLATAAL